ncbi:hypothetical protein [Geodermatophilus amargosae]|uniref:hypothetical protein n=1 Tax=Geodermatophilus amargosae TaxID=1296565 RepID=UPI0034DF502C
MVHSPLVSTLAGLLVGLGLYLVMPAVVPEPVSPRWRLGAAVVVAVLIGSLFSFVRGGLGQR